jgi:phosphohistidine phosphatase SixA
MGSTVGDPLGALGVVLALGSLLSFTNSSVREVAAQSLTGPELVRALQQGGFVLYLRHATTTRDQQDAERIDLDRCETQRGLSEEGRRQARAIGEAFTALRIPVGRVLTGPFCRAVDTAQLAFGRYEKSDVLTYGLRQSAERRKEMSGQLRALLAAPPAKGANTVLISHNGNLRDATNLWPKEEGDMHVFRPGGTGFEHVAEIPGSQWAVWVRALGPPR